MNKEKIKLVTCIDDSAEYEKFAPYEEGKEYEVVKEFENSIIIIINGKEYSAPKYRFAEYVTTKLPKKWAVKVDAKTRLILKEWVETERAKKNSKWVFLSSVFRSYCDSYAEVGFYHYPCCEDKWHWDKYLKTEEGYVEISIEDFKKYVLNEDVSIKVCDKKLSFPKKRPDVVVVGCKDFTKQEVEAMLIVSKMCKKGVELTFNDLNEINIIPDGGEEDTINKEKLEEILKQFK